MVPSYISRSVAGSYDNEGVAIFALVFVFYTFIKVSKLAGGGGVAANAHPAQAGDVRYTSTPAAPWSQYPLLSEAASTAAWSGTQHASLEQWLTHLMPFSLRLDCMQTVNTGSLRWGTINLMAYFYMVLSWGGYSFVINLIPIYVLACIVTGRVTARHYLAFAPLIFVGTILAGRSIKGGNQKCCGSVGMG